MYEDKCHTEFDTDYKTGYELECLLFFRTNFEHACEDIPKEECAKVI